MIFNNLTSLGKVALCTTMLTSAATGAFAINVTPTSDAFALANTLFLNVPGLAIQDAQIISGEFDQLGTYMNPQGTYGLPNTGILLSTGNVSDYATGPGSTFFDDETGEFVPASTSTAFGNPATDDQNAQLQPITGQDNHNDVAQLKIEFFAQANVNNVTFFGTFGSEEFPEFVGSSFIDGFGLFVNGTNVAGAVQTGGGPVQAINIDHPDMTALPGTELNGVLAPNGNTVLRFDVPVNPGQVNVFDIIIADASDSSLDSTIYLSSFFSEEGGGGGDGLGQTEFNPILPSNPADPDTGQFIIELPEPVPGQTVWIDPPVTVGYEYDLLNNPAAMFTTFTAPSLASVPDLDGYTLTVGTTSILVMAGQTIDFFTEFSETPQSFVLTGINPAIMLDPGNPLAFPVGVTYSGWVPGTTVGITPLTEDFGGGTTPVPLPAGLPMYLAALAVGGVFTHRRRKAA